jgi:hypothetical protein
VSPIEGCETSHPLNSGYGLTVLALGLTLLAAIKGQDFWPCIAAIANKVFVSLGQARAGTLPALFAMCDLHLIVNAGQGDPGCASKKRATNKRDQEACFFRLVVAGT